MEDLERPLDADLGFGETEENNTFNQKIRQYWRQASGWAIGLGVLSYLGVIFILVASFFILGIGGKQGVWISFFLWLFCAVAFYGADGMFGFGSSIRNAADFESQDALEDAARKLRNYYRGAALVLGGLLLSFLFSWFQK